MTYRYGGWREGGSMKVLEVRRLDDGAATCRYGGREVGRCEVWVGGMECGGWGEGGVGLGGGGWCGGGGEGGWRRRDVQVWRDGGAEVRWRCWRCGGSMKVLEVRRFDEGAATLEVWKCG